MIFQKCFPSLCSFNESQLVFLTYCSRLPPSTSRLDHLAKHFIAIQCDVVGLFDGLLCHLLAVNVELDFLWRDGDVELQEGKDEERAPLTSLSPQLPNWLQPLFGKYF